MPIKPPHNPLVDFDKIYLELHGHSDTPFVIKIGYENPGYTESELTFNQESATPAEDMPERWSPLARMVVGPTLHTVFLKAERVQSMHPHSLAEVALEKLLAEIDADPSFARSPRKILDRLRSI